MREDDLFGPQHERVHVIMAFSGKNIDALSNSFNQAFHDLLCCYYVMIPFYLFHNSRVNWHGHHLS